MNDAFSFIISLAILSLIWILMQYMEFPDLMLAVVGIGFFIGVIVVFAQIHSISPIFEEHHVPHPPLSHPPSHSDHHSDSHTEEHE